MNDPYEREIRELQYMFDEVLTDEDVKSDDDSETDDMEMLEDRTNIISTHETDSEQELSMDGEEEEMIVDIDQRPGKHRHLSYYGKTGFQWNKCCFPKNFRTRQHNLIKKLPGVIGVAKNSKTAMETWKLFSSDNIVQKIVEYTNQFIEKVAHSYKDKYDVRYTDITEIKALIGLLYLAGVHKGDRTTIYELWATYGTGLEIFPAVMAKRRFRFLIRWLHFDDVDTREERKKTDNLAPIRELFGEVNGKFRNHYSPGEYVTIDEMLLAFRGRCAFRMYIPNKPARYGIKIYSLVDDRKCIQEPNQLDQTK
nr:piggyBac transposable element-derived protein 4-like [Leptinotarsa decemlineata]